MVGGNLLGPEQSGHIDEVGIETYFELLEEAVRTARADVLGDPIKVDNFAVAPEEEPEIHVPVRALIPEDFVPALSQRLGFYRRLSTCQSIAMLHELELEIQNRYGTPPQEVQNIYGVIRIKLLLREFGIRQLTAGAHKILLVPATKNRIDPSKLVRLLSSQERQITLTPDHRISINIGFDSLPHLERLVAEVLNKLCVTLKS